jgi:cell division protein FtsI (penicillin-binding protein 3)
LKIGNCQFYLVIFLSLLIAAFLALAGRCFYLQYLKGDYYYARCISQQQSCNPQRPRRGVILDCRGRVLAASNRVAVVFAEPRLIKEPKSTSSRLAPVVDMGAHEICKLIMESGNPGYVKVKTDADALQCSAAGRIYGVGVQYDWLRHYPMGRLASHAVGFTSTDNRGLDGIEFKYDKELTGSAAENIFFADVHRRPICLKERNGALIDGRGIILTLDAAIQQFARAELAKQRESYQAESAVAIVAEPKTGAILAMVSLPDFDPNDAGSADANSLRNRAITDQFEPGSIIKPVIVAIAVDSTAVGRYETIFCENGNYIGKGFGRIGEYRRGFGDLTISQILIESSNIGMAKIGQKLGKEKLHDGLKLFGFGQETGIELPGEAAGLLRPAHNWTGYSVTRIPFGQEISVTAIQLVQAFCIIANGGHLVWPHLVRAMVDDNGTVIKHRPATPAIGYIVKPEVAKWLVSDPLVGVINEGTGTRAKLDKWQAFGKSGTAQIARPAGGGYEENAYIASFVAGAPAEDPQVIVLVSIRRPNVRLGKGYTGGMVAAPVVAAILGKTLNYLQTRQPRLTPRDERSEFLPLRAQSSPSF